MLAKNVNDDAGILDASGALWFFREHARSYRESCSLKLTDHDRD
jgi:hypothetical protein